MSETAPSLFYRHPAELNLYHRNPRVGAVDVIMSSLRANNQYKPVLVNAGTYTGRPYEVLAGNHTVKAIRQLAEQHPDDERWQQVLFHQVDVDDDRAARIVAADNRTAELGSFDEQALVDLLSELPDLEGTGYSASDLTSLETRLNEPVDLEPKYSSKSDVPQYVPVDEMPQLDEIVDIGKTTRLLDEIDNADIAEDVKVFLRHAAQRHTVIDFHKAADYYAGASSDIQRLMEKQALVIIDFDNAIRNGYVRLTQSLRESLDADRVEGADEL